MDSEQSLELKNSSALSLKVERPAPPTWNELAESFETIGKVGLAMAVGFSAAGLFCRLAEQGKVRIPGLAGIVLNSQLPSDPSPKTATKR